MAAQHPDTNEPTGIFEAVRLLPRVGRIADWDERPLSELREWFVTHLHRPSAVYFRYGADSTPGWITTHRAEPLRPGLYGATAEGRGIGGLQRFMIDSTGRVTVVGDTYPRRRSR